jgi:hypothetical protein
MNTLLIHGCYDSKTLKTLKDSGTREFAFDLRARSSQLIPYKDLKNLLKEITGERIFLSFQNDRHETVNSYLNLLKDEPFKFIPLFRDSQNAEFYKSISAPFFWMFNPEGDWNSILKLSQIRGILLPVKWQMIYQNLPSFWSLIDEKRLEVYLHVDNFEETAGLSMEDGVKLSIDLTSELEIEFRKIDQEKLKNMKIWRKIDENSAGQ